MLFFGTYRLFHIFFKFAPGHHNLMPAALTFNPDIRSGPDYFPYAAPARMLLFHFNQIAKLKLFWLHKINPCHSVKIHIPLPAKMNLLKPGLSIYLLYRFFLAWIYFYKSVQFCYLEKLFNIGHKTAQNKPAAVILEFFERIHYHSYSCAVYIPYSGHIQNDIVAAVFFDKAAEKFLEFILRRDTDLTFDSNN